MTSRTFLLNRSLAKGITDGPCHGQWELAFSSALHRLSGLGCGESSADACHLVVEVKHSARTCWEFQPSLLSPSGCVGFSTVLWRWCFRPIELSLDWQHLSHPWAESGSGTVPLLSVLGVLVLPPRGAPSQCPPGHLLLTLTALRSPDRQISSWSDKPTVLRSPWWVVEGNCPSPAQLKPPGSRKP